jgi:hypothetical protein
MTDGIDAGFGDEEEDEIEDESEEGDGGSEAGDTCAAADHWHLAHMGEEAKDGRSGSEDEGDDVEDEGIGDPLDGNFGDFDWQLVPYETIDVWERSGWCGGNEMGGIPRE